MKKNGRIKGRNEAYIDRTQPASLHMKASALPRYRAHRSILDVSRGFAHKCGTRRFLAGRRWTSWGTLESPDHQTSLYGHVVEVKDGAVAKTTLRRNDTGSRYNPTGNRLP
jgi:hypothetical protein